MTLAVKVRQGGLAGAATKDFTSQVPIFDANGNPQLSAAMMYGEGHGCQSSFPIDDPIGQIPELGVAQVEPHNAVWVTEDAPGHEAWLCRGRVARGEGDRGVFTIGAARQLQVVVEDANVDLRGLALTAPWARPAETATDRVMAAIAAFCQGSPRPSTQITAERWNALGTGHLVKPHPTGGEVTMTAETYPATTDLLDIIRACAETEGQNWGVVIHHAGGSHLCFLWTEEDDWDTYPCPLTITDDTPDLVTEFPPIWDQGAAVVEEGQDVLHAALTKWGTGENAFAFAERPDNIERYDYWVESMNDATSQSQVQADQRAGHLLAGRAHKHVTHQVSLLLPASMVDQICAGMSIPIRAAASRSSEAVGTTVTRRIAQVKWEPVSPKVGGSERLYMAHLQLARPLKIARERRPEAGPKPPTGPTAASCARDPGQMTAVSTPNGDFETGDNSEWTGAVVVAGDPQGVGGSWYAYVTTISPGWNYNGWVGLTFTAGQTYVARGWANNGSALYFGDIGDGTAFDPSGPDREKHVMSADGEFCIEWTPSSTTTNVRFRQDLQISSGTIAIDNLQCYTGGSGDSSQPIGEDGDGTTGTDDGTYALVDHVHEHGNLTGAHDYHDADQVSIDDAGGYFTGTDVEAALQELGAGGGVTDHGALTGLADDDHTHYLTEARHDALAHASARWSPVTTWNGDHWIIVTDGDGTPVLTEVS